MPSSCLCRTSRPLRAACRASSPDRNWLRYMYFSKPSSGCSSTACRHVGPCNGCSFIQQERWRKVQTPQQFCWAAARLVRSAGIPFFCFPCSDGALPPCRGRFTTTAARYLRQAWVCSVGVGYAPQLVGSEPDLSDCSDGLLWGAIVSQQLDQGFQQMSVLQHDQFSSGHDQARYYICRQTAWLEVMLRQGLQPRSAPAADLQQVPAAAQRSMQDLDNTSALTPLCSQSGNLLSCQAGLSKASMILSMPR